MSEHVTTVRVAVPGHLRTLAGVDGDVEVDVLGPVTVAGVVDAIEVAHPMLAGTIRDRRTRMRRPMIRTYADGEDYTDRWDEVLPDAVTSGREPLRLIGAVAGG